MTPLFANAGVPMILPQLYLMGLALIPVVLIESLFVCRIPSLKYTETVKGVAFANITSTLVGIPIAWVLMLGLETITTGGFALGMKTPLTMLAAVTLQAAWLIPYEEHLYWMIPAAATTLLVPSFVISVFIERFCLFRRWKHIDRPLVSRGVFRANVYSYLLLFVLGCVWFTLEVASRPLGERLPRKGVPSQPVQQFE
ncbi:MAG: hypothetical protein WCS99_22070 [Limisphaerales bacterium]